MKRLFDLLFKFEDVYADADYWEASIAMPFGVVTIGREDILSAYDDYVYSGEELVHDALREPYIEVQGVWHPTSAIRHYSVKKTKTVKRYIGTKIVFFPWLKR